ncbi:MULTISPECIES: hypothetical protein [unclassified Leeuwenhoekiella]|uniref:hypothetical protein n=1 Tax=unclassified Leeuwenhoekiella TaxID=2615029 RepID=UPI000C5E5555|nr:MULTISPECIES: hypothetical protein [unclassified Leeuwenhoekiella]MAW93806.1 hypothetical protein [Leeuwenhoekiella sp.]MBA80580.1 hypothetical protein [Leeuwenhoekiella sp.]|tara:strand:+ start:4150 stop:4869 length:720 start_codon:yes stop_codon:yes gene_type:complete
MLLKKTNIHDKLYREEFKNADEHVINWVNDFISNSSGPNERILNNLASTSDEDEVDFNFDLLDRNRIFHEKSIKKICIDYRLRFLDSRYFKGNFPQEALSEINRLEQEHKTSLSGFKIMAPSKLFVLSKTDDPLLFAPMGNGYYYLIHKWGNDLHPLRKLLMWPFKNFENLIFTVLLSSILATALVPDGLFTKEQSFSQDVMVFFFMFKSIAAVVLYYGFASGKNFNTAIWRCQYDKAQ